MVDVVFDNMKDETRPDMMGGGNFLIFRILLIFYPSLLLQRTPCVVPYSGGAFGCITLFLTTKTEE